MRPFFIFWSCTFLLVATGCGGTPQPPFRPVADVRLLMESVVEPSADVVWDAVGTIMTEEGTEEIRPQNDEEWTAVRNSAITLAECGNLLMLGDREKDTGEWRRWSLALVDAGEEAMQAASAQDADAIFAVGETIYDVCEGCHGTYWKEDATTPAETAPPPAASD